MPSFATHRPEQSHNPPLPPHNSSTAPHQTSHWDTNDKALTTERDKSPRIIEVGGVEYAYATPGETVRALRGVNLTLEEGSVTVLHGASGSGKSTLLNLLAGLDVASAGKVRVLGQDLAKLSEPERSKFRLNNIGLVFQEHNLVPQLTAAENVEILMRARGITQPARRAMEALETLGLTRQARRRPSEMSGGQRQRVGIARAIAGDRPLVLCDEPTGALDSRNSAALFALLQQMAADRRIAVLIATHDMGALEYATQELEIEDGLITKRRSVHCAE